MLAAKSQHLVKAISKSTKPDFMTAARASFGYDHNELKALSFNLQRKINLLKMHTENKEFNYE